MNIQTGISDEDKTFLEMFTECTNLSFNNCQLRSLDNMPKLAKLIRFELSDNKIEKIPKDFCIGLENLQTLKIAGNDLKTFESI